VAQNRVTPFGTIEDLPGRGALMGNRGCLHKGTERRIARRWASKAWITCVLEFRGWRAPMWEERRWTPLFFLDEATAFAAGHRPCGLCRRADHARFRAAWGESPLDEIDAALHAERTRARPVVLASDLARGAMVAVGEQAYLVVDGGMRPWSMAGYGGVEPVPEQVVLLTPPSIVDLFWRGYAPVVHESAVT